MRFFPRISGVSPSGSEFVYLLESAPYVKIGCSWSPCRREKSIRTLCPNARLVWQTLPINNCSAGFVETTAMQHLSPYRVAGEWFEVSIQHAIKAISHAYHVVVECNDRSGRARPWHSAISANVDERLIELGIMKARKAKEAQRAKRKR